MSNQQVLAHILEQLESFKKELIDVSKELSDSPLQIRLSKISNNMEVLIKETSSHVKKQETWKKTEEQKSKDENSYAGIEDIWNTSEKVQKPPDLFSSAVSESKPFESSKIKNAERKKHQRGASRHQRVWSMNSAADFEEKSERNIFKELQQIIPDTTSSDDEREKENLDPVSKEEEVVGNPVIVSAVAGSDYQHERHIRMGGVMGPREITLITPDGKMREHMRNTSMGGVMTISSNDDERLVAKQIQDIMGGSKDDLDLARKHLQLKTSKIDLVKSTAEEISRLRDIIKMLGSQLQQLRNEHNKLLNGSFGGQIFGAVASLFYTR